MQQIFFHQQTTQLHKILKYTQVGVFRKRWYNSNELFPKRAYNYIHDLPQENQTKTKHLRFVYESPMKATDKRKFKTAEFRKYQEDLENLAKHAMVGKTIKEIKIEEKIEPDPIYGFQERPQKTLSRPLGKELFFYFRNEKYMENSNRKIAYLTQFQPNSNKVNEIKPFIDQIYQISKTQIQEQVCGNQQIIIEDDFYAKNQEIKAQFDLIGSKIPDLHQKQIPDLALTLSFTLRYNKDVFGIWQKIEERIKDSLNHYSTLDLAKIHYASCSIYPKSLSHTTQKAIIDIVFNELDQVKTLEELTHILFAFRNINSHKYYIKLLDEITKRPLQNVQQAIHLLHAYAHSRFPVNKRKQYREKDQDKKENEKILNYLADILASNASSIKNGDDIVRVLVSLNNLQTEVFKDVLFHLERNTLEQIQTFDGFQIASIMYGFAKSINNYGFGSEKLYQELIKKCKAFWNEFTHVQKSHAFFAMTSQDINDNDFRQNFIQPWLNNYLETDFNYSVLHYVAFSLIYEQNKEPFENLFLIEQIIVPEKVVILVQGEKQSLKNGKATPAHRAKIALLEMHKYAVFNIVFKDFEKIQTDSKLKFLEETIKKLVSKQKKYIEEVEEQEQWLQFMDKKQKQIINAVQIEKVYKGGKVNIDTFDVPFDWSKLQGEFKKRQMQVEENRKLYGVTEEDDFEQLINNK
ncbi:hypothetical protein IMG5_016070 [Ichthyophthirius multifiliis]|uniref:Uncharacterized protein n=1 Tax=Ichthyophthirius multifiliis TaxID=5932 RepID=G0QKC3_ICHMU|nr:hypothetical protein IMG5_016070 [Ichthyophthirius multifiliis]EGR34327.1 hypothetical protein IMG5_016070 [Ichthyophthirius multifiliis]|eukprot:XP_004039631.1 hypothetical protein IMG5_016070 [Ichthyophthirius multifiliis]